MNDILVIGDPHQWWDIYLDKIEGYPFSVCLGDLGLGKMGRFANINSVMPEGTHYIIRGNHDRKSIHFYLTHGFDFVCDTFTVGDILFTHRPVPKRKLFAMGYELNLHGHIHQKAERNKHLYKNLSVERTNYYPIKLDAILGEFKMKLKRKLKQGD